MYWGYGEAKATHGKDHEYLGIVFDFLRRVSVGMPEYVGSMIQGLLTQLFMLMTGCLAVLVMFWTRPEQRSSIPSFPVDCFCARGPDGMPSKVWNPSRVLLV